MTGNDTDTVTIQVYLDDANDRPKFGESSYNASVEENREAGTFVFEAEATDADQQAGNREFTYRLGGGSDVFSIDPQSGTITTKGQSVHCDIYCILCGYVM